MPVEDLTFINFFYENNGAGKSSIAHAIDGDDGVEWADGKASDDYDVLVYNQNFINDNFENYGDLAGVLIFGEEDIEAKKKIAELTGTEYEEEQNELENAPIAELDFSVRTYNVLTKAGYSTVRELLDADPDDIIKLPDLGLKSFSEIIDVLGEKGFEWKSGKICKSYSRIKVCKDEN